MKKFSFAHLLSRSKPRAAETPVEDDEEDDEDEVEATEDKTKTEEDEDKKKDDKAAVAPSPVTAAADEIVHQCTAAGLSHLASGLIKLNLTSEQVKQRLDAAPTLKDYVKRARNHSPAISASLADEFIVNGTSTSEARATLFDLMVANQSPEISTTHAPGSGPARARDDHGWGKAIAKRNG